MSNKDIEIIGSGRIILGILILIIFGLSMFFMMFNSLIGPAIYSIAGLPILLLIIFIIISDFIILLFNDKLEMLDKSKIRKFLSIILILALLSIIPFILLIDLS